MVVFQLSTKVSPIERKLGKEPIMMNISEWEMNSMLSCLSSRNKGMYHRIMRELIDEAKSEGYEIMIGDRKVKIICPKCQTEVTL